MASAVSNLVSTLAVKSRPVLKIVGKYAAAEMTPPKLSDIPAIKAGFGNLVRGATKGSWKNLTVREAGLNTLIAIEVWCWFFVGECIGKHHLVGYKV